MESLMDIDRALNVDELRGRCLEHSRKAYRLLPQLKQPRILDIGCGQGQQTMELARLGESEVIGIDIDQAALSKLRQRINQACLGDRIKAIHVSLLDNQFDDNSLDLLNVSGHIEKPMAMRRIPRN
jgi:ubiquinone/menaquinone biosynthesis C-methylase UbiE